MMWGTVEGTQINLLKSMLKFFLNSMRCDGVIIKTMLNKDPLKLFSLFMSFYLINAYL